MKTELARLKRNVRLADYTTWKVGGTGDLFAEPISSEQMSSIARWAVSQKMPLHIIGAGSNLLISDLGIEGLTLCSRRLQGSQVDKISGWVEAQAGEPMPSLARKAGKAGLSGFEWAIGIPGTVGGAVVMNAGAHGSCIAEWLAEVVVIDPSYSEIPFTIAAQNLDFGYRYSNLQIGSLTVISARFRLNPGFHPNDLLKKTNQNLVNRIKTQPYKNPSCGSVFKNPAQQKVAIMIEKLGLKGIQIGGAQVSKIHSNFIVNKGGAKAQDINALIRLIQKKVRATYGNYLCSEVKLMGRFPATKH